MRLSVLLDLRLRAVRALSGSALCLVTVTFGAAAGAATIEVTTTEDELGTGASCSLREAVASANDNVAVGGCPAGSAETDDIVLAGESYAVAQGQLMVSGGSVRLLGTLNTAIVGSGGHRLLWIAGATASIESIVFADGAVTGDGGAILATGSNVTIRDSTFENNTATFGGGYCQFSSTTEMTGVTIENNVATGHGGGVFNNNGILEIHDSTIELNRAESNAGGGIYNSAGSSLTITGTSVAHNQATQSGGGIHNLGSLSATALELSFNEAPSGGGMRNDALAVAAVNEALLEENHAATRGGGIHNTARLTLEASIVRANEAPLGGGLYVDGTLALADSVIEANGATSGAGVYFDDGELTITDTEVNANVAAGEGGGLFAGGPAVVERATFAANTAQAGAGMRLASTTATVRLTNVTISGNVSSDDGGGVLNSGVLRVESSTIFGNTGGAMGGGVAFFETSAAEIGNSVLGGNSAASGQDCSGSFESLGHNLLGEPDDACDVLGDPTGNVSGTEPQLAPLARGGGAVRTHAPLAGSPVVDAGSPAEPGSGGDACDGVDARGVERPVDGDGDESARCDIGAFEGSPELQGDTTCDGSITTADALGVLRESVGLGAAPCGVRGEVTCDDSLSATDALAILKFAVGLPAPTTQDCPAIGALS